MPLAMSLVERFGLNQDPFLDTADPSFYFETMATANHRRRLIECLADGRGLAVILGPIGVGKTTLCNAAQAALIADERAVVGLILDPSFADEAELLRTIGAALGLAIDSTATLREIKETLKQHLFQLSAVGGRQPILFIDEAQLLDESYLQTLRALLNYQLDERKLLSVALSGQMELESAIAGHPNFADRVALWLPLAPLSQSEAAGLIDHRLRRAGFTAARSPFDDVAMEQLWRRSGGFPRRLITLAREAMETAGERGHSSVTIEDIAEASSRFFTARETVVAPIHGRDHNGRSHKDRPWWAFWRKAS